MRLQFREALDEWLPLGTALTLLLLSVAVTYHLCLMRTAGTFVYPLDDSYIHLSIARQLADSGVWGVTSLQFSSASSSVFWPIIIAAIFRIIGVHTLVPLYLTLISAVLLLYLSDRCLLRVGHIRGISRFFLLVVMFFFVPLLPNSFSGMEHLAHACASLLYCWLVADELTDATKYGVLRCALAAMLVTGLRYEGMALVGIGSLFFFFDRRWLAAASQLLSGAAPIIIFGLYAVHHGAYFLPNSVLIKSNGLNIGASLYQAYISATEAPTLSLLMVAGLLIYSMLGFARKRTRATILLAMFMAASSLQLLGGQVGWYFRYEAYLNALGIVSIAIGCSELRTLAWWPKDAARVTWGKVLWVAPVLPMVLIVFHWAAFKSRQALISVPRVSEERYLEHVQPARFVRTYYPDSVIAVNDIGAMCYMTNARIIDIFGLGSIEPVKFRRKKEYTADKLRAWIATEGAEIAILQVQWPEVSSRLPKEWIEVAEWQIPSNLIFKDAKIGVFALQPADVPKLVSSLRQFQATAPDKLKLTFMK